MFEKTDIDVLVAGAGPVGLTAALFLAKAGRSVRVIDRGTQLNQNSYALALHPASLEVFAKLNLSEKLIERGRKLRHVGFYQDGKQQAAADMEKLQTEFPFVLVLPQSELEEVLQDELKKEKVRVEWDRELTDLSLEKNAVTVRIGQLAEMPQGYAVSDFARVEKSSFHLTVPFLIGADGYHSTVRHHLDIKMKKTVTSHYYAVFEFETPANLGDEVRIQLHDGLTSVLWPMPGGKARWSFEVHEGELGREHLSLRHLEEFLSQRAPWFSPVPQALQWASRISFEGAHAEQFGKEAAWLAGDSSHLNLPVGVQSLNAGLMEADLLADCLILKGPGTARDDLLKHYEQQRLEEWHWLLNAQKPERPAWLAENWDAVRSSLPATGSHLRRLLEDIG